MLNLLKPILLVGTMALSACASNVAPNSQVVASPSNADFMAMDAAQRDQTLAAIQTEDREISRLNETLYNAGRPVHYGDGRSGYTVMWARQTNQILFFPGHTTGAMGQESQAIMVLAANNHGRPVLRGGVPVVISASASHQEGLGRFFARGAFGVIGSAANGAIAARIHANSSCTTNCGDPTQIIVDVDSASTATATGTGTGSVCATCGILD